MTFKYFKIRALLTRISRRTFSSWNNLKDFQNWTAAKIADSKHDVADCLTKKNMNQIIKSKWLLK